MHFALFATIQADKVAKKWLSKLSETMLLCEIWIRKEKFLTNLLDFI